MGNENSKKSSADLAPGPKRLKMDESGATLDLKIGVKKETEGQRMLPESPAQKVLRLPELVSMIFGHLAADSDLKSLKNARVVCSLWKHEVSVTLRNNLSLMPYIIVEHPESHSLADYLVNYRPHKSLQISRDSLMPGCGLPLNLAVNEWTPELESFIRDFSREIVQFEICGIEQFVGFPAELGTIKLPALRHTSFTAHGICSEEKERVEFVKALTFWKELLRVSENLKTSYVSLEICELDPLPPDNSAFDKIEWSEVGDLTCTYEFLAHVTASNELSWLQDLICYPSRDKSKNADGLVTQISLAKAPNLTKVELKQVEWILDHQMSKLEILTLEGVRISGRQPPSKLLPNLEEVYIYEESMEGRPFACLISGGGVFENVVELTLYESWMNLNELIGDMAVRLVESFPKLKKLDWHSYNDENQDFDMDVEVNNNALYAFPVIFSRLVFLTTLEISTGWLAEAAEQKVVELLIGISLDDIPEEEASWPTALVDNPHSISNLKYLKSFHLDMDADSVSVVPRQTRFLFTAAFRTMETLEEIYMRNIIFEDTTCAAEWQQMGRRITLE